MFGKWIRVAGLCGALAVSSLVGASASMAPTFALPSRSGDTVSLDEIGEEVVSPLADVRSWPRDAEVACMLENLRHYLALRGRRRLRLEPLTAARIAMNTTLPSLRRWRQARKPSRKRCPRAR